MGDITQLKFIADEFSSRTKGFTPIGDKIIQMAEEFDFEGLLKLADSLLE